MDIHYTSGVTRTEPDSGITYRHFSGYYLFRNTITGSGSNEKTNRDGLILAAKSTTSYNTTGELITGNDNDSVKIFYAESKNLVYHGRSAAVSILNLFSKEKEEQEPWDEIKSRQISGSILFGNESFAFTKDWLAVGPDTLRVSPVKQKRKIKTGKIKKAKNYIGIRLMKGNTCIAAIDDEDKPEKYYLLNDCSEKEKLIIVSWLQVRMLELAVMRQ